MPVPLDFLTARDDSTASWERSDPAHAVIRQHDADAFDVELPDGDRHRVHLHREHGAYVGRCDCKGWQYRDVETSPCAHLCAVRRAAWCAQKLGRDAPGRRDTTGDLVTIDDVDDLDDDPDPEPADHGDLGAAMADDRLRADGGERVEPPANYGPEPRWTGR